MPRSLRMFARSCTYAHSPAPYGVFRSEGIGVMFVLRVQVGLVILMFWAVCGSEQIGPRGQHDYFSCRSSDYGNSSRWLWFSLDRIEWVVFQIPETTRYAGLGRQEREPIEGDDHFVIFGCYRFSCDVSTGSARRRRWIEPGLGRSQQQDVIFTAKRRPLTRAGLKPNLAFHVWKRG